MSLPEGWTPLAFADDGGLPQSAPLPAAGAGLRAVLVGVAPDLAAVLSAAPDRRVWSSADALARRSSIGSQGPQDTWRVAQDVATAALTAVPGDTLSPAGVLTAVLVVSGTRVLASWPALPGRPLPVHDTGTLLGHLWVDAVTVCAGSLVSAGPSGSRFIVGWRPLASTAPTAAAGSAAGPVPSAQSQEDPYAGLV